MQYTVKGVICAEVYKSTLLCIEGNICSGFILPLMPPIVGGQILNWAKSSHFIFAPNAPIVGRQILNWAKFSL